MMDFLPLYDADCMENGNIEFDTYNHPHWKNHRYNHYVPLVECNKDQYGQSHYVGPMIKLRIQAGYKEVQTT